MRTCAYVDDVRMIPQTGNSPFVYRDGAGWPASLPYIWKIRISIVNPKSVFTKGYLWSNPQPKLDSRKVVKIIKVHFHKSSSSHCCCCCCCCPVTYLKICMLLVALGSVSVIQSNQEQH